MKNVYVDASNKKGIVAIVVDDKVTYHSVFRDGKKLETEEAEIKGIVLALKEIKGDITVINDNESLVEKLKNSEAKIGSKIKADYDEIITLSKGRKVVFKYESRCSNKAGLKLQGFSLYEINNPKILQESMVRKKEMKEKYKRIKTRARQTKSVKKI